MTITLYEIAGVQNVKHLGQDRVQEHLRKNGPKGRAEGEIGAGADGGTS